MNLQHFTQVAPRVRSEVAQPRRQVLDREVVGPDRRR
jgi:hypothetical protein